ncbi:MAG TPA: chemotaxis protein CheW [Anaeromyxobacteraceae bacterium]|nr:chemotaxis protein CheW [Anaeromyxobacteraceae bacterium]
MASLPSERKALLFSAGGVRLALRLAHIREIVNAAPDAAEVRARGESLPAVSVAAALGLPEGPAPYALLVDRAALRAEALHGIVDLAEAEVFQLPARTTLPSPAPFVGAVVWKGAIALELAPSAVASPPAPAAEEPPPPAGDGPPAEREFLFARAGRTYGVPLPLLLQVLEGPRVAPVPLAPPSHRGLVYHGRAIHPVLDVAVRYGHAGGPDGKSVLLLDAGGSGVGVLADRVLGLGEATVDVVRPPWDALW